MNEKREIEAELAESERRFRVVYERSPIGIGLLDFDGRFLDANPALERLLGYGAAELRDLSLPDITHEDDSSESNALYAELATASRENFDYEHRLIRSDSQLIWVRSSVSLVRIPEDHPSFALAMIEDITERKRAEQYRLDLERARLRRQQALELNDNVVQGLAVAKMALEANMAEKSAVALDASIRAARRIISDLLGDMKTGGPISPGDFVRDRPASLGAEPRSSRAGGE